LHHQFFGRKLKRPFTSFRPRFVSSERLLTVCRRGLPCATITIGTSVRANALG
jgi:hypothetical protein